MATVTRLSVALTGGPTLVVGALVAPGGVLAVAAAMLALALFVVAQSRQSSVIGIAGAGALFGGVGIGAVAEISVGMTLLATVGAILAWDSTAQTISLRQQVDNGEIHRALLAHVGATLAASSLIATVIYLAFLFGGAVPPVAVVLFLLGAVLLVLALEPRMDQSKETRP